MRYFSILLLLFFTSTFAKSTNKNHTVIPVKIHCFKIEILLDELKSYGEDPIFIGSSGVDKDSVTMMFVNQQTGSYTIVGMGKDIGCVYDTGNNVRYRMPKVLENKVL